MVAKNDLLKNVARVFVKYGGNVVGGYSDASGQHAFLYSGGAMTDLGTLGCCNSSAGQGINDSGQVTGYSYATFNANHAFLYSGGVMTDVGTLGGSYSLASGINNSGQITGYADTGGGPYHAFLYSGSVMTDLGTLGGASSGASGINTAGQVVERYVYDPYGAVTVLAPDWTARAASGYAWQYLYQGGRYDAAVDLYSFRPDRAGRFHAGGRRTAVLPRRAVAAEGHRLLGRSLQGGPADDEAAGGPAPHPRHRPPGRAARSPHKRAG